MKNKLLLTVITFFSFLQTAFPQDYHPFLNNSSWILRSWTSFTPSQVRAIDQGTDVVIGNYTYKKFHDTFPQMTSELYLNSTDWTRIDTVYIREDVAQKKVYHIVDGADQVLYDFNMAIGDTIFQYGLNYKVIDIDQVAVAGGTRKRITLRSIEYHYGHKHTQKWIEGVGTNAHPFYPQRNACNVASSSGGYNINTICSFQDGVHLYSDPTNYCTAALGIQSEAYNEKSIVFSPNPFSDQLNINSAIALKDAVFKLYDLRGQLVYESTFSGTTASLNRAQLSSGLYFAQLFEDGTLLAVEKIIVN